MIFYRITAAFFFRDQYNFIKWRAYFLYTDDNKRIGFPIPLDGVTEKYFDRFVIRNETMQKK